MLFKEGNLKIAKKNGSLVEPGMVFNVCVSISNLTNKKGLNYAFQLADTVLIGPDKNSILTKSVSSVYDEISYQLDDDEEDEEKKVDEEDE